jgi:tetratricopeptide (TPR) repeat protein
MKLLTPPLRDRRAAVLLVAVVAAAVYANSLWNEFAYDDVHIVVDNEAIHSLETLPGALVAPYWPTDFGRELGLWRPATTGTLGLLYAVGGGTPLVFHAANVIGHAVASILVLLLCAALMPLPPSLAAGLVFAVHPVHVEAVSNVIGMGEILSASATLLACLVLVRGPARSGWGSAGVIAVLYAIAFGAKESGVVLPGLIFLLDAARRRIAFQDLTLYIAERWRAYLAMALVAGALLLGRYTILGSVANPFAPLGADLLSEIPRIWTLGEVWTHYVRLWVFPLDLYSDYSPNVIPISLAWRPDNLVGALLALTVLVVAIVSWKGPNMSPGSDTSRTAAFGVVWFVIAISPVSNMLFLSGVVLAERTLYLPSVGLAAATGWLVSRLARTRPRGAWMLLVIALGLSAVRTWTRTPDWKTNQQVFGSLIRDAPHSGRAQWILGDEFLKAGNVSQAMFAYRAAINILGGHYSLMTGIAQRLMEVERYRAAESLLLSAWQSRPQFALGPSLIAWSRAQFGDAPATEAYARASLALYEDDVTRHHLLAWALAAQGRFDEARAARARAESFTERVNFWHRWMYVAYERREAADSAGVRAALDSAWASVATGVGRRTMDSLRVAEFGLSALLAADSSGLPGP